MCKSLVDRYPALRNREYVLILGGNTLSGLGDSFNLLAVNLVIYRLTESVGALTGIWAARVTSRLLVQLIAGVYVDRWNRRYVLLAAEILSALVAAAFILVTGPREVWLVYLLIFLMQSIDGFAGPAFSAGLASVLQKHELPSANSLNVISAKSVAVVGPALAGIVFSTMGATPLFVFNSFSFLVSFACLFAAKSLALSPNEVRQSSFSESLKQGLKVAASVPSVIAIIVMAGIGAMVWRVIEIGVVAMADNPLAIGEQGVGYLFTTIAVGGLTAGLMSPLWKRAFSRPDLSVIYVYLLCFLPFTLLGFYPTPLIAYVSMFLTGFLADSVSIFARTTLQIIIPRTHMGRVFALQNVSMALGVLPIVVGLEAVINVVGHRGALLLAGAVMIVGSSITAIVLRGRSHTNSIAAD